MRSPSLGFAKFFRRKNLQRFDFVVPLYLEFMYLGAADSRDLSIDSCRFRIRWNSMAQIGLNYHRSIWPSVRRNFISNWCETWNNNNQAVKNPWSLEVVRCFSTASRHLSVWHRQVLPNGMQISSVLSGLRKHLRIPLRTRNRTSFSWLSLCHFPV